MLEDARKHIRLVHLDPAVAFEDPIVCTLSTAAIDGQGHFETLSYCWGDEHDLRPMMLNGSEYFITKNLESALRHLRLVDKKRIFWIDSISINQADDEEKSEQVQQMGRIFSASSKVVIWLGRACEDDDTWSIEVDDALLQKALVLARSLRVAYETFWHDDPFRWARYLEEQTQDLKLAPASDNDPAGQITAVLINLLGRPWFTRMWVIQEAHIHPLAPEVVIGFSSAQLVDFTYTAHYIALMEDFRTKKIRPTRTRLPLPAVSNARYALCFSTSGLSGIV